MAPFVAVGTGLQHAHELPGNAVEPELQQAGVAALLLLEYIFFPLPVNRSHGMFKLPVQGKHRFPRPVVK